MITFAYQLTSQCNNKVNAYSQRRRDYHYYWNSAFKELWRTATVSYTHMQFCSLAQLIMWLALGLIAYFANVCRLKCTGRNHVSSCMNFHWGISTFGIIFIRTGYTTRFNLREGLLHCRKHIVLAFGAIRDNIILRNRDKKLYLRYHIKMYYVTSSVWNSPRYAH